MTDIDNDIIDRFGIAVWEAARLTGRLRISKAAGLHIGPKIEEIIKHAEKRMCRRLAYSPSYSFHK